MNKVKVGDISLCNVRNVSKKDGLTVIKYLDTSNLTQNRIDELKSLSLKDAPSRAKRKVKKNDILISTVRPNQKHFGFIKEDDEELIVSTGFAVLSPNESLVNPKFLYYFLTQESTTNYLQTIAEGATTSYPSIKPEDITNLEIELPPLEEQRKIANYLSNLDNQIELNNQINQELEEMAQTLYNYWFVQFEFPNEEGKPYKSSGGEMVWNEELKREIPAGWEVAPFCENKYNTFSKEKVQVFGSQKSYIATGDVIGVDISANLEQITFENRPSRANSQPIANTIWLAKMKDSKKLLLLTENDRDLIENTVLSTGFSGIKSEDKFLFYTWNFINNDWFEAKKDSLAHGATQQAVNEDDLRKIKMVIPVESILDEFNKKVENLYLQISNNRQQNQELAQLRDFMLPLLMNGQVVIEEE